MQAISDATILSVTYYECGRCENRLGLAYRGESYSKTYFPAGVFLIEHATQGYTLFDTGYSRSIARSGCLGWLYRHLNPVHVTHDDEIANQLLLDGISPDKISRIVLSHLHPDHIGGIESFHNSRFIISNNMFETYKNHNIHDLILDSLIPDWFDHQVQILEESDYPKVEANGINGWDVFGDSSLLLIDLEGHAHGHLGALIPDTLLLAGDACWNTSLLDKSSKIHPIMNLVNHDKAAYVRTQQLLVELKNQSIRICCSHDIYNEKVLIHV